MPLDPRHRGHEIPGLPESHSDARLQSLIQLFMEHDPSGRSGHKLTGDPYRSLQNQIQALAQNGTLRLGKIVHALPHVNWYRVQVDRYGGVAAAIHIDMSNRIPIGPRFGSSLPADSRVLLCKLPNDILYLILGVIPHRLEEGRVAVSGWLTQGGNTGVKREAAHQQLWQMFRFGGVQDYSCQSPLDATSMDSSEVTETGIATLLTPFEWFARVSEICGIWLSLLDHKTTIAGWNLDLLTGFSELVARHDEGEACWKDFVATYPWEALGLATPSTWTGTFDDKAVQYSATKGKVDLPDGHEDIKGGYRSQHYRGYLGQGGLRFVTVPNFGSGIRHYSDPGTDAGVFAEHIGLDGSAVYQSAKSVIIAKRGMIAVPREIQPPESPAGDDARENNYKFSGLFGSAQSHIVNDVTIQGEPQSVLRAAGVEDLLAWNISWKRLHPFFYHKFDYSLPTPIHAGPQQRINEALDFSVLGAESFIADPEPVMLKIDHRYNSVAYYEREAFLALLDGGEVVLRGGSGEQLSFVGGNIYLTCPGTLYTLPGRSAITMAGEVILKSQASVDVTSSAGDLRLRAFKNLQIGSDQTVLIEGKGFGSQQNYFNQVGENVSGNGVILSAPHGVVGLLGQSAYIQTLPGSGGDIVLNADGTHIVSAQAMTAFLGTGFTIWCFPDPTGPATVIHQFTASQAIIGTELIIKGTTIIVAQEQGGADLVVDGDVLATGDIACGGQMADQNGQVGKTDQLFVNYLDNLVQQTGQGLQNEVMLGNGIEQTFMSTWTKNNAIGDPRQLTAIGFSYRDSDQPGAQYHTADLQIPEGFWQQLVRQGGATGGSKWNENPVSYQGRQLYPWPGREIWTSSQALIQGTSAGLYNVTEGVDSAQPGDYPTPTLAEAASTTLADGFVIIPPE